MCGFVALVILTATVQDDGQQAVDRLVEQLGSDEFAVRDEAMKTLREIGPGAREALEKHKDHKDPEIRARVRDLLSGAQFLPVEKELRVLIAKLDHASLSTLKEAVEELLKLERKRALDMLKVCAEQGVGRLQFRAKQIRDILGAAAETPVRYGILLSKSEYGMDEKVEGLEIWANESDKELRLKDIGGKPKLESLEPKGAGGGGLMAIKVRVEGGPEPLFKSAPLAAGASRVVEREDLLQGDSNQIRVQVEGTSDRVRGANALTREYKSDKENLDQPGGDLWEGTRRSNRVEFQFR